jgi:hypothetical protein
MAKPKPSPVPKSPALVRARSLAVVVSVGLGGFACGGTQIGTEDGGSPPQPQPLPADDAGDATDFDTISPQPAPVPDADLDGVAFLPAEASTDGESDDAGDAQADVVMFLPPTPAPHP